MNLTVGTGSRCPECSRPRHVYHRVDGTGRRTTYNKCTFAECARRRRKVAAEARDARNAAMLAECKPLPEPPEKPKAKRPHDPFRRDKRLYWSAYNCRRDGLRVPLKGET